MRMIPLDDIRIGLSVTLRTMPKPAKCHLAIEAAAEKEIVETVMRQLERCVVVAPDMIGLNTSMKHGEFGVTEPHPFPDLIDPYARKA